MFSTTFWILFIVLIFASLLFDLGVLNKKPKVQNFKEALTATGIWIVIALIFCLFVYHHAGKKLALEFLTGYIIELSLSMDNVFVIAMIFKSFNIPMQYHHRVLFWGILGAIIMRLVMIVIGVAIIEKFIAIFYVMGLLLIVSGMRMIFSHDTDPSNLRDGIFIRLVSKCINVSPKLYGEKFFIRKNKKLYCTILFVALIAVEQADLVFAIDSIPAVLAVSQDAFVVFSSNILAILGLRSLYFMLSNLLEKFTYIKYGLSGILVFIGCKMVVMPMGIKLSTSLSLFIVLSFLFASIAYSMYQALLRKNST